MQQVIDAAAPDFLLQMLELVAVMRYYLAAVAAQLGVAEGQQPEVLLPLGDQLLTDTQEVLAHGGRRDRCGVRSGLDLRQVGVIRRAACRREKPCDRKHR